MDKEEKNHTKDLKKINQSIYILMGLMLLLSILTIVNSCSINKKIDKETEYDVSMMRAVGIEDVLDMFEDGKTYVLYIGRENCSICHDLLPTLQQAQINNNYITQYLDILEVDRSSDNWKKLVELLDQTTTTTMDEEGKTEEVTETYGYFLDKKGFTPCVILIKDGKQYGGFFGNKSLESFEDWLANCGI